MSGQAESGVSQRRQRRWSARLVVGLVVVVLSVVFIVENTALTPIRVIIPVVIMPLWAALAGTMLAGIIIGLLIRNRRREGS